jgi:hypothetical protein
MVGSSVALVVSTLVASLFIDEPLRHYMERAINANLRGYSARLPALSFHPFGFSITLESLTIAQNAHPKPPVAVFPELHASVQWRALLHGRLVADILIRRPRVHINLPQLRHEAADAVALRDKGWQQALEAIYPLKINLFRVEDGDLVYVDTDAERPLHVHQVTLVAENIRNVRSPGRAYPSEVYMNGIVFDSGKVRVNGQANFLAEPYAGVDVDVALERTALSYFKPMAARVNLWITGGTLWADGHIEYSPQHREVRVKTLIVREVRVDYIHSEQTAAEERERAEKVERTAQDITQHPRAVVRVDHVHVADGTVGYVDRSAEPGCRIFLSDSDMTIDHFTNQEEDEPATIVLKGRLFGHGNTVLTATVRPAAPTPNLTTTLSIENTPLRAMNDVLRRFGNFDVVSGWFSLHSELRIEDAAISGYVKPILSDMNVYSRPQDAEKPVLRQAYEGLVGAVQTMLQNRRGDVGTKVDISGTVSQPEISTWEIVFGLLENAFIKAISHGFEKPDNQPSPARMNAP